MKYRITGTKIKYHINNPIPTAERKVDWIWWGFLVLFIFMEVMFIKSI